MAGRAQITWELQFGAHVRAARNAQRLTLRQLAAKTGLHWITVRNIEVGLREPTLRVAMLLAAGLGISLLDLVDPAVLPLDS